jgi:pantetheine-phosphate adenylyltransferase
VRRLGISSQPGGVSSILSLMRRLAIYPGSFDPPTLGHLDVIERASKLFDEIVVALGVNSAKKPLLTEEERLEALRASTAHLSNVKVESFHGLLVDYVKTTGAKSIVRGLRATADFEYEFQMAMVNRRLAPEVDTVFLMTKWEHSYLSSSIVREVATLGGDYSEMVPKPVAEVIHRVLRKT